MAKGNIALYEQFHLLPKCFQMSSAVEASYSDCTYMWESFKHPLISSLVKCEPNLIHTNKNRIVTYFKMIE